MRLFRDVPIQKKLRRITMLTTSVALLLTGVALIVYELVVYRSVMTRELMSLADVIGANSAAALAFNDSRAAEETLHALRADPRITSAAIYTADGQVFATYLRGDVQKEVIPARPPGDGSALRGGGLALVRPIMQNLKSIGAIYIRADLQEAYARLRVGAMIVLGVLLASSLVALFLASTLERVISQPILNLAHTAAIVSEMQDYSVRAAGSSQDELGQLIDGFNEMLAQIQRRDTALQEAQDQLEATVEHRTRQLQAAKQQAEEVSRHKSAFLANMSHELRTPLNAILGFASLLQNPTFAPLSEKQTRFAKNIVVSGQHLLALINDLLDLSKVEAGKLVLQRQALPLREAIEAALHTIHPQAELKQQALELSMDDDLQTITADPTRFRQILYNLLSNAVKFTPEGGTVTVTARTVCGPECGPPTLQDPRPKIDLGSSIVDPGGAGRGFGVRGAECVEIAVTDTGIGIKPEDLPKLFQIFTQLEPTLTKQFQGTGLGLALTKQLVESHGGSIRVASEGEGLGSTFTIWLPLAPQERPETGR